MLSKDDIKNLAELAKLSIEDEELDSYLESLNSHMEILQTIKDFPLENGKIPYTYEKGKSLLREDRIGETLTAKDALKNTLEEEYGYFKILNVME